MKKDFSKKWKSSKQPRKQRKYLFNMSLHMKNNMMSAPLDKILKAKYKTRNVPLRKGDTVLVMRGKSKGRKGKVDIVEMQRIRVSVEGLNRTKKTGDKVPIWFHPSKLMIKDLKEDKKRFKKKSVVVKKKLENKSKEKSSVGKDSKPETSKGDSNAHKKN